MKKYFSGEQFTRDEIIRGVHTGVTNGSISPVLCGCSSNLQGIDMLLDCIVDLLPSPWEKGGEVAVDAEGEPVEIDCTDEAPLAAYVFKTVADPFVGKLSYVKVISGKLSSDAPVVNARTGQQEKLGKIIYVIGKKQEDTAYITAGDIGAVTKLTATQTGDTLCDPKKVVSFDPINFPRPCLSMAIKPQAKGDEAKVASSLQRLIEEDPTIAYENNAETHQQVITGLGEQHLDVLVSKLKNKFGVSVSLEVPRVPYRETIRKKVKVQGKHKKQSGGHGQFGDVWIEFEPTVGDDLVFEEKVFGGAVPKSFFPAVEKGLQDCVKHGVLGRIPGCRPEGDAGGRFLPPGRLLGDVLQDGSFPGLQGRHAAGFPGSAGANRQPEGLRSGFQHRRHHRRSEQAPRQSAGHEPIHRRPAGD